MKIAPEIGILMLTCVAVMANSAVSDTNGKIGAMHGSLNSESASSVEGSITCPIQDCFGFQLDGLYSNVNQRPFGFSQVDDTDFGGVGGHFFWRNSESALLGLETAYVFSDSVDAYELAIEAELYFDWLTIGASAGVAGIDYDQPVPFVDADKDAFFGQLYLGAYPVDNLLITVLLENRYDNTFVGIEAEYELPLPGLSIFANAMSGNHDYDHAFVGMRYYFGEEKSLKRRHRESDPKNHLSGVVSGISSYSAEIHEQVVKNARRFYASGGASTSSGSSMNSSISVGGVTGGGLQVVGPESGTENGESGTSAVEGGGTLNVGGGTLNVGSGTLTVGSITSIGGSGTLGTGGGTQTIYGDGFILTISPGGTLTGSGSLPIGSATSPIEIGTSVIGNLPLIDFGTLTLVTGDSFTIIGSDANWNLWDPGFFTFTPDNLGLGNDEFEVVFWNNYDFGTSTVFPITVLEPGD